MFFLPPPFFHRSTALSGFLVRAAKADYGRKETSPSSMKHNNRRLNMKKRYTDTQIVAKLRQADVLIGQNKTVPEVCREIEVSQQTYYRWRQKYGGMNPEMIKEFRELQKENARLRKVVADQAIDNAILKEAAAKNF
jgi:putative transposase